MKFSMVMWSFCFEIQLFYTRTVCYMFFKILGVNMRFLGGRVRSLLLFLNQGLEDSFGAAETRV